MHLKKIILGGFKSFADRITVNFDEGITGIVGPNGSGKSNIIDAVRWVMGEQNAKQLRGQIATDIIFAGSAKRKAVGMAEVSLVFDNRDASAFCPPEYQHEAEISITRRLYSDGSREYLLNKKPCRLKDVTNFFATTGLGGRSYSMIQQGQVDRILNAKPEDVREILEEAAGTTIYKARRQGAQKKLELTREHLDRLQDLIGELERQRNNLEGQVEKAEKWQELHDELKSTELYLLAHQYHSARDHIAETADVKKELLVEQTNLSEAITKLDEEITEAQGQLDDADPELEQLSERVTMTREGIARAEHAITHAEELEASSASRLKEIQDEVSTETNNLKVVDEQLAGAVEELEAARNRTEELNGLIASFQDELDLVDEQARQHENRLEDGQDQLYNIDRLLDSNSVRCESIQREQAQHTKDIEELESRAELIEGELTETKRELDRIQEQASTMQEGLDEVLERKTSLEQKIQDRTEEIKDKRHAHDNVKEQYFEDKARASSLEDLASHASNLSESLDQLFEAEPSANELIQGLLTDVFSFNDSASELPKPASMAFERWAEQVIVESYDDLQSLTRLLESSGTGGFPVYLKEQHKGVDEEACRQWAERTEATPLAHYIRTTEPAVQSVIERLYHLPSLGLDPQDLASIPAGLVVFTSNGLVFSGHDDIYVGSRQGRGVLSWKAELEELQSKIKESEAVLALAQSEVDSLEQEQQVQRAELKEITEQLSGQNESIAEITTELKTRAEQVRHKEELRTAAFAQIEEKKEKVRVASEELTELGQARIAMGQEKTEIEAEMEEIREESTTITEKKTEVHERHQSRKVELAKSEVRMQSLENSTTQIQTQQERLQSVLTRRYEEQARIEMDLQEAKERANQAKNEIAELLSSREKLEAELSERREENAGLLENIRNIEGRLKEKQTRERQVDRELADIDLKNEKSRLGAVSFAEQALEKYQIEISDFEYEKQDSFDIPNASRKVGKMRSRIESLGAINMLAIEEHKELMERYEFIEKQKAEILSSIDILEEALDEIETTSRKKFMEVYETINREFGELFPILFPTGTARLQLTDENDPLNAGVEIMCQLPGKKTQRMNLFSGGEKALTAISLIFALLKTKPTPFCFLDEVDAPLDEANVGRYNRVLEALAERFQFIVITHNRRTMEVLDTLYGVVMQEPGVSKIVGIDLERELPDHLKKSFKEEKTPTAPPPPAGDSTERAGATAT